MPFRLANAENPIPNIRRNVDSGRDKDRANLLLDQNKEWDGKRQQKGSLEGRGGLREVRGRDEHAHSSRPSNYHEEPAELRTAYGDRFGINCLLARRLVGAGCLLCRDRHGRLGHARRRGGQLQADAPQPRRRHGPTLIKDLAEKDMLKDTLGHLVRRSFGRTPSINAGQGPRSPPPTASSVVMAGRVASRADACTVTPAPTAISAAKPVPIHNLFATLYQGVRHRRQQEVRGPKAARSSTCR